VRQVVRRILQTWTSLKGSAEDAVALPPTQGYLGISSEQFGNGRDAVQRAFGVCRGPIDWCQFLLTSFLDNRLVPYHWTPAIRPR